MRQPDKILPGVVLMLAFCMIAPLLDVSSKLASASIPVAQIVTARFIVQCALMLPVVLAMGLGLRIGGAALGQIALRALFLILSTYSFVAAISVMPVADALAIAFVEPFVVLLIGHFVLREEVGPRRLGAATVGFIGALFVIQPSFSEFGAVALFPLGTAVCFALYILITRALSRLTHPVAMQFHTAWIAMLLCLPPLLIGTAAGQDGIRLAAPEGIFWLWCAGVGLAATISHMSMTYALKFAPSSTLAPIHYFEMLTATLFGYLVFGDFPNWLTWIGVAIITGSGLYIIHRERVTVRARAAAPPAPR